MPEASPRLGQRIARLSRRSAFGGLGVGLAGAGLNIITGACGGPQSRATTKAGPASNQGGNPRPGGQLTIASSYDPSTFDPATKLAEVGRVMLRTNDSLLSYKSGSNVKYDEMVLQPGLTERWETADGQSFTFHLAKGAKFASLPPVNGRDLSSADIQWSYEYLSRSGDFKDKKLKPSSAASMLAGMERIETPDPTTVIVHFSQPFAPFLSYAASQWLPILPHEIYDEDGDFSKRIVGSGPFQLDPANSQRGSRWVYKKNPTYYRSGLPYIGQLDELILPEQATQQAAFQSKQIDILDYSGLTLDTVQQVKKSVPSAFQYQYLQTQSYLFYMNTSKPPLNDQRIRKALALSINRDEFIKAFANGSGDWALAASIPGLFTTEETKQILKYDPSQARQLVAQAGYPNGVDIEFIYATSYGNTFVAILQLFQSQAKQAGLNVALKGIEHQSESGRRRSGDYQLGMTPRGQGLPLELDSYLYGMFYPGSTDNQARVDDPQLTPLLEAQRREIDPTKRVELWKQAIRRVNEVPWAVALYYGPSYNLWYPRVKNYAPNMSAESSGMYITSAWLDK